MDSSSSLDLLISDPQTKLTQMTTEQRQLMGTGLDDLNDINVTSLVGYRDSLLLQQQTPIQSNEQNINTQNISLTKSSSSSFWQLKIPVQGTTPILKIHLENQHQEKPMASSVQVVKKSYYKCQWDLCEKAFVGLENLRKHVLDVHVDGFDEEDGKDSGEVSVETLKEDEQSIEQVNPVNHDESTLDEINENEKSMAISHDHESTNAKSSQQLLIVSDSSKESIDEMVLEDDTDLDEQPMDYSDSTDSDDEKLHQYEHSPPELNKSTDESKSMNPKVTIWRPYRCWYCDDSFEMVDCLKKHFEAFHSRKTEEESESDSDDHSLGEMDSDGTDLDGTDSDKEFLEETDSAEESLEGISLNEKNIHSQQLVTQQQTLNKSINQMDDDQDGKIEVIDGSRKLHYATTDDNEPKGSNINKYSQQQPVHPVTELNQSTNQSSFNCPECGKSFRNDYFVRRHLRQVHPKQLLYCGVSACGKGFKSMHNMLQHYLHRKTHEQVNVPCDQCKMFGINKDFKAHLQTHHSISFGPQQTDQVIELNDSTNQSVVNCPECGKSFTNKHSVKAHLLQVHPKQMFFCRVSGCGKWCNTINDMMSHYRHKKAHKKVNLPCDQCKKFGKDRHLKVHLEKHHAISFDPKQPEQATQITEINQSTNQSLNCPECGISLRNKTIFDTHLLQVHPKQMFFCRVSGCGKSCKTIIHMLSHYHHKTAHKKVNLPCDECKTFGKNKHFKEHLERDHSISFDLQQPSQ